MVKKIVIVDDEVHIRLLLEQTLEELEDDFDVEILSAADGEEGLALIRLERPELVLLDIMMPKMNGFEVCQAVRDDQSLQQVKIVLLTAKGQKIDRKHGMELGAYKYLTNPFNPDEIIDLAKEILDLGDM